MNINEKQEQVGKTADKVQIVEGLAVWTNEMSVGVVSLDGVNRWSDGWFDVVYADGRRVLQNGERVATRFGGRDAAAAYEARQGAEGVEC